MDIGRKNKLCEQKPHSRKEYVAFDHMAESGQFIESEGRVLMDEAKE